MWLFCANCKDLDFCDAPAAAAAGRSCCAACTGLTFGFGLDAAAADADADDAGSLGSDSDFGFDGADAEADDADIVGSGSDFGCDGAASGAEDLGADSCCGFDRGAGGAADVDADAEAAAADEDSGEDAMSMCSPSRKNLPPWDFRSRPLAGTSSWSRRTLLNSSGLFFKI